MIVELFEVATRDPSAILSIYNNNHLSNLSQLLSGRKESHFCCGPKFDRGPGYLPLCLGLWDLCGVSVAELWQSCGLVITVLSIKYNQLRQNTQSSAMSFITVGLDENKTYNR